MKYLKLKHKVQLILVAFSIWIIIIVLEFQRLLSTSKTLGYEGSDYIFAKTTCGVIKGSLSNKNNVPIVTFKGIPYAKPPVGKKRIYYLRPDSAQKYKEML